MRPRAPALALLLLAACSSVPATRFYVLEPAGEAAAPASKPIAVNVGPVDLAESLDRPWILRRLGAHEVDFDESARWGEPLAAGVARVLAEDLARALGTERVGLVPGLEEPEVGWRVTAQVLRFEVDGEEAVLEARWRLIAPGASEALVTRRTESRAHIDGEDVDAAVSALSDCLADLAHEVAKAIAEG